MHDYPLATRMQGLSGNAIREIFKLLASPEIISFAGGNPSPASFPVDQVRQITDEVLSENGKVLLQYGATEGYAPLRESVCPYLSTLGVTANPEDTLIISGAQQGIDLLCKALVDPGDVVLVERPTYLAVLHILHTYQAKVVAVKTNEDGLDLEDLEVKTKQYHPKFLYLVPTFQNPTGRTLPLEKRRSIAELAARNNLIVVEDDPYRQLRYRGEALPALHSFDQADCIVYLTSFSKVIGPGLRTGVAVAPASLLRAMVLGKQATDVHSVQLGQAIVDEFLRRGWLPAHLEQARDGYRVQMQAMLDGFRHFPGNVEHTEPDGGLFIWCTLPEGVDAQPLLAQAVERKVAFVPGASFFADGTGQNTFRLNFSYATPEKIEVGMKILGELLHDTLEQ